MKAPEAEASPNQLLEEDEAHSLSCKISSEASQPFTVAFQYRSKLTGENLASPPYLATREGVFEASAWFEGFLLGKLGLSRDREEWRRINRLFSRLRLRLAKPIQVLPEWYAERRTWELRGLGDVELADGGLLLRLLSGSDVIEIPLKAAAVRGIQAGCRMRTASETHWRAIRPDARWG